MLKTFRGGVHPHDKKGRTSALPIVDLPPPNQAVILLSQHIGAACKPVVQKDDRVRTGQVVGQAQGFVSAPVHASITGKVIAIEPRPNPATGARTPAVVIEQDGDDEWAEGANIRQDTSMLDSETIKQRILEGGIVGLGGATFPTHVKLSPPPDKPIDTMILNGAECEPYLTCDHRLMVEQPEAVLEGFGLLMRALRCSNGIIGIEANKPDALAAMRHITPVNTGIRVAPLKVKYPQGGEHQLILALLKRDVPWHGGLPMAVGVVVQNVATAYAVYEAICFRRPLVQRVVTVTGEGVENPGNFRVRIGTPVSALLDKARVRPDANRIISGGPMMGIAQRGLDAIVTKGTSGILVLISGDQPQSGPCIRCGRCVNTCPYGLMPAQISRAIEASSVDAAVECNVLECKECGCCTYVCPAKRQIVHQVKLAKAEINKRKAREKAKSAKAG